MLCTVLLYQALCAHCKLRLEHQQFPQDWAETASEPIAPMTELKILVIKCLRSNILHYLTHKQPQHANSDKITSREANAFFICPPERYSMPVACCLLNEIRVTSASVKTLSLLPACFIAGLRYIAAVLEQHRMISVNTILTTSVNMRDITGQCRN